MKHKRKIIGVLAFCAAVFLVGCGEQSVSEMSSSSVESSTASVETSSSSSESISSSSVESSVDMGDGSTDDIAVIVTDNQDIIKSNQSSQGDSSSNSDPDTHEPTSSSSSSSDTSKPTTSQPTSSSLNSNTSKPSSSSTQSSGSTSAWNPDAPGNKPGPYGGYYDANGALHCKEANMPTDSYGYPVVSYYTEDGMHVLTKAEKEAARAEEERIDNGGGLDLSNLDGSKWGFEY